jgi:hypothetical protein
MTQGIHGNARMKVEIFSAMLVKKAHAFAALEREFGTGVGAIERRHGRLPFQVREGGMQNRGKAATQIKNAPPWQRVSWEELGVFHPRSQRSPAQVPDLTH